MLRNISYYCINQQGETWSRSFHVGEVLTQLPADIANYGLGPILLPQIVESDEGMLWKIPYYFINEQGEMNVAHKYGECSGECSENW